MREVSSLKLCCLHMAFSAFESLRCAVLAGPPAGMQAVMSALFRALETLAATVAAGASGESETRADSQASDAPIDTAACDAAVNAECSNCALQPHSPYAATGVDAGISHAHESVTASKADVCTKAVHWPSALADAPNGCPAVLAGAEDSTSEQALLSAQAHEAQEQIATAFEAKQFPPGNVRC